MAPDSAIQAISLLIPLKMELETALSGCKVDLQVLKAAPLSFRHRVVQQGVLVADNAGDMRCHFEYLSRYQYFDFRRRRDEYFRELLT
jgi:hypothetical protein